MAKNLQYSGKGIAVGCIKVPCCGYRCLLTVLRQSEFGTITMKKFKQKLDKLFKNDTLQFLMLGVFAYTCYSAVIMATLQVPPEAILDSGLQEILMVFEG